MPIRFSKYHGIGNDFVVVDCEAAGRSRASPPEWLSAADCAAICNRKFGIGADGVIMYAKTEQSGCTYQMRIINGDGTEAQMCGNGIRCLAHHLAAEGAAPTQRVLTGAGVICTAMSPTAPDCVAVNMGRPRLLAREVPTALQPDPDSGSGPSAGVVLDARIEALGVTFRVSAVSMGNPHGVIFVDDLSAAFADIPLAQMGPALSENAAFPEGANIEFVEVLSPSHVKMIVWERGSGRTLACGTGACAVVVAGVLTGRLQRHCVVSLEGGDLTIEWNDGDAEPSAESGGAATDCSALLEPGCVIKTGPACRVFVGALSDSISSLASRVPTGGGREAS